MIYSVLHIVTIVFSVSLTAFGQNTRLNTNNAIGWYNYFGTFKLSDNYLEKSRYLAAQTAKMCFSTTRGLSSTPISIWI